MLREMEDISNAKEAKIKQLETALQTNNVDYRFVEEEERRQSEKGRTLYMSQFPCKTMMVVDYCI
jgi:hypothetical protein